MYLPVTWEREWETGTEKNGESYEKGNGED